MVKYISLDCLFLCVWEICTEYDIFVDKHKDTMIYFQSSVVWPIFSQMCLFFFLGKRWTQILIQSVYGRTDVRAPSWWEADSFRKIHGKLDPPYPGEMLWLISGVTFSAWSACGGHCSALNGERQRHLDPPHSWGHAGLDRAITPSRHTNICTCLSEGLALLRLSFSVSLSLCQCLLLSVYLCFFPLSHYDYLVIQQMLFSKYLSIHFLWCMSFVHTRTSFSKIPTDASRLHMMPHIRVWSRSQILSNIDQSLICLSTSYSWSLCLWLSCCIYRGLDFAPHDITAAMTTTLTASGSFTSLF